MDNFLYKTRDNSAPHGKRKVYFCCHPMDFEKYFPSISDEILEKQNCAIQYARKNAVRDEAFLADLTQTQLFVMPVTANLLCTPNEALDVEFPFAVKNGIPVLPLMQENDLEALFNEKCGDRHILNKSTTDTSGVSYDEKLKRYLETFLVGDELAQKIREAFDAKAFLSYRKKDRKHALELMRLVHKNDFFTRVAIWYDDFLIPGDNFNVSIKEELKKSNLFLLAVTPNIVNESNYIMTTEYPLAKKDKKTILPVELIATNRELLSKEYSGIPAPVDAHNEEALSEALLTAMKKIEITNTDDSPMRDYYIGLAYLSGIDVEVNFEKALQLISGAANRGLWEAQQKMVDIYTYGIGVTTDYAKACHWKEKCNQRLFDELTKDFDEIQKRQRYIERLQQKRRNAPDMEILEVMCEETTALKMFKCIVNGKIKKWCEQQLELSDMYWAHENTVMAEQVLAKTIASLFEYPGYDPTDLYGHEIIGKPNSESVNTTFIDMHIKLIEYLTSEMKYSIAEEWNEKLFQWISEIEASNQNKNLDAIQIIRNIALMRARLQYQQGNYDAAKDLLIPKIEEIVAITNIDKSSANAEEDFASFINTFMDIYMHMYTYMDFLSDAYMLLADTYCALGMINEAFHAYNKAVANNNLAGEQAKADREIIGKLRMAKAASDLNDTDTSMRLLTEVESSLHYSNDTTIEISVLKREYYKIAGEIACTNETTAAIDHLGKAVAMAEKLAQDLPSVENLLYLAELCAKLYHEAPPSETAQTCLQIMYKTTNHKIMNRSSAKSQKALADICFYIFKCNGDTQALKKSYELFRGLSVRYPTEKRFAQKAEEIKQYL